MFDIISELEDFASRGDCPSFSSLFRDVNTLSSLFPFSIALKIMLLKYYLPLILAKVDTSSMHNSVESRTPYLSPEFVSNCLTNTMINAKPDFFKHLLPYDIHQLLLSIPKEGFSPSSSYKQSQLSCNLTSMLEHSDASIPSLSRLPLLEFVYFSSLLRMPGLQRLNSLFTKN